MVAVAAPEASDLTDQGEWIIMTNVDYAVRLAGGPVVGFSRADFSAMQPGDDLCIVHHGWIGGIQDYDAGDIVARLVTPPSAIPPHVGRIVILSCGAGLDEGGDGGAAGVPDTSLVDQVKAGLIAFDLGAVQVTGAEGAALSSSFTSPLGAQPRVVDDARWDLYELVQTEAMRAYHDDIVAAIAFMEENRHLPIDEVADVVAQITRPFYERLVAYSDDIGVLFAAGTGIRTR